MVCGGVAGGGLVCAGELRRGTMVISDSCETGATIARVAGVRAGRVFRCVVAQGRNNTRLEWVVGCEDMKGMTPQPLHPAMNCGASMLPRCMPLFLFKSPIPTT